MSEFQLRAASAMTSSCSLHTALKCADLSARVALACATRAIVKTVLMPFSLLTSQPTPPWRPNDATCWVLELTGHLPARAHGLRHQCFTLQLRLDWAFWTGSSTLDGRDRASCSTMPPFDACIRSQQSWRNWKVTLALACHRVVIAVERRQSASPSNSSGNPWQTGCSIERPLHQGIFDNLVRQPAASRSSLRKLSGFRQRSGRCSQQTDTPAARSDQIVPHLGARIHFFVAVVRHGVNPCHDALVEPLAGIEPDPWPHGARGQGHGQKVIAFGRSPAFACSTCSSDAPEC